MSYLWDPIKISPHRKHYWFLANPSHTKIARVYVFLLDQVSIFDVYSCQVQETYTHGTVPIKVKIYWGYTEEYIAAATSPFLSCIIFFFFFLVSLVWFPSVYKETVTSYIFKKRKTLFIAGCVQSPLHCSVLFTGKLGSSMYILSIFASFSSSSFLKLLYSILCPQ